MYEARTSYSVEWDAVTILRDHATTPNVKCNYCGDSFAGGATRIRAHLIDKRLKLQSASYRQRAEKWDSDSDSDETDEEELKV